MSDKIKQVCERIHIFVNNFFQHKIINKGIKNDLKLFIDLRSFGHYDSNFLNEPFKKRDVLYIFVVHETFSF